MPERSGPPPRRRHLELRLQREIAADLRQRLTPDRLLARVLRTLAAHDGAAGRAAWYTRDAETGTLRRVHDVGLVGDPELERLETLPIGSPHTAPGHRLVEAESGGEVLGALLLVTDPDADWDEGHQVVLESVALQLALALESARLRSELAGARAALRDLDLRDPITGVWNRKGILERVEAEHARATRRDGTWSVVLAELDRLEALRARGGHGAIDTLLRSLAARIGAALRPYDDVGRRGRGEFLVLLPHTDNHQAARVAERIRLAVEALPLDDGTGEVSATLSLGVASSSAGESVQALLSRADRALGAAKVGENRVVIAA